jgi:hypothetical protein
MEFKLEFDTSNVPADELDHQDVVVLVLLFVKVPETVQVIPELKINIPLVPSIFSVVKVNDPSIVIV